MYTTLPAKSGWYWAIPSTEDSKGSCGVREGLGVVEVVEHKGDFLVKIPGKGDDAHLLLFYAITYGSRYGEAVISPGWKWEKIKEIK